MFKRMLFISVVLLMFIVCFSVSASAIQEIGSCGDNLTYTYDAASRNVFVSGVGEMYNYKEPYHSPFYGSDIVSVEFEEDITSIGSNAFYGCDSLETVIMSDSIITINNRAFESCSALKNITFSDSLADIGTGAFVGCEELNRIAITSERVNVGDFAFDYCTSLTELVFFTDVDSIGINAFKDCWSLYVIHIKSGQKTDAAAYENIPSNISIHWIDCIENIYDCVSGNAEMCLYCKQCDKEFYICKFIEKYPSHLFGNYISDGNFSCLSDGTKSAKCERCSKIDTIPDIGSGKEHIWSEWQKTSVETCYADGEKTRFCTACLATENETVPALSHINSYVVDETPATCTSNGYEKGVFCPDCQKWLSGHGLIKASGHVGGTAFCCGKAVCTKCGKEYGKIDSDKHLNVVVISGKEASCTEAGYTESKICADCKTVISESEQIAPKGHTESKILGIGATCTKEGATEGKKCLICGLIIVAPKTVAPKGHSVVIIPGIDSTCAQAGASSSKKCVLCEAIIEKAVKIPAKGHIEIDVPGVDATCTKAGVSNGKKCSRCGVVTKKSKEIAAKGHKVYTVAGVDATCTKAGTSSSKKCSVCNTVLEKAVKIPAKGHTSVVVAGTDATCTKAGTSSSKRCSVCDTVLEKATKLPVKGHVSVVVPGTDATCTKAGLSSSKKCSRCDTVLEAATKIPAKGHTKVDVPGKTATCTKSGLSASKKCSTCGVVTNKAKEIPAKGHSEIVVAGRESTCTKNGLTEGKKCSSCNKVIVARKKLPLKSHKYKTTVIKKATLTYDGEIVDKCSCGAKKSKTKKKIYSVKTLILSTTEYTYNSNVKTPNVTVKDRKGTVLKKDKDYFVEYESGRKTTGKYTVLITFTGKYSGTKKLYFTIAPKATSKVNVTHTSESSVTLKWNAVTGADGYRVYKYNSDKKKYEKVKDITDTKLKVGNLKAGSSYRFKIKAFRKDNGIIWGKASEAYSFSTNPDKVKNVSISKNSSSVTLKWSKVAGASGYYIYRYYSGEWKKVETLNSGTTINCKFDDLKPGNAYKFRVRAFRKSGDSTLLGAESDTVSVIMNPATPALKVTSAKSGAVTLSWSNVNGESGYQIYYSTKKDGEFKKLGTFKSDVRSFVKTDLTSRKTYYFKIRSYKKTSDGILCSPWSSVYGIIVK